LFARMRSLRPRHTTVVAYLALFVALGGTAVAAKPLLTGADVQDGSLSGADVQDNSLSGADVQDNSLTGSDVLESSLGTVPDADTLDGIDSADFVQGRGTLLTNRLVFVPQATKTLLDIPGLGTVQATCFLNFAEIDWANTTGGAVDFWRTVNGRMEGSVVPGNDPGLHSVAQAPSAGVLDEGAAFALGVGNDPGPRRVATLHVFAFQSANFAPCGFQIQGTLWVSP
jgi:hypothetical protein